MKYFTEADLAEYCRTQRVSPVPAILHCPKCGLQHIDRPETDAEYAARLHESAWWELGGVQPERWNNPPHASHKCAGCKWVWRPMPCASNGVVNHGSAGELDQPYPDIKSVYDKAWMYDEVSK